MAIGRTGPGRIKVVYLDHVARLSGGELALANTLPALLDRVDALVVLAEDGPLVGRLRESGITTEVLPLGAGVRELRRGSAVTGLRLRSAFALAAYVWRVSRLIRREHADVVHTNSLKAALYGGVAGRLAGVPVLWHVRDRIAEDYLPRPGVLLVRALARILPSGVVANSRSTLATLPFPGGQVLTNPVVHDGAVLAAPQPAARGHDLTVGLVGRLSPWKGQDLFLRAFAEAFPDGPERAVIVGSAMFGEDDYAATLPLLAAGLGVADRVTFRGFTEDVPAELATFDVLVHCSTVPEPFGQVVLEGMAAGLAVLAANEGGPSEVVTDGVDGLLVAPRDPQALARALRRVAEDAGLREELARAAVKTASRYTPESTADGLLAAYETLLRTRRSFRTRAWWSIHFVRLMAKGRDA